MLYKIVTVRRKRFTELVERYRNVKLKLFNTNSLVNIQNCRQHFAVELPGLNVLTNLELKTVS